MITLKLRVTNKGLSKIVHDDSHYIKISNEMFPISSIDWAHSNHHAYAENLHKRFFYVNGLEARSSADYIVKFDMFTHNLP